ncbi:MAG: response regulator [Burkholderiaceae bacterium]
MQLKRILYVEDDNDIREVAGMALEHVGQLEVLLCASGRDALEKVEDFAPDMVVLDVMMPDMDGPATLLGLRKIPSMVNVPVVFVTAKVQPSEVAEFLSLGAVDIVAKPFDPMTLTDSLRQIWARVAGPSPKDASPS